MRILGKDKKTGKRVVMLTDFEWETLITALNEYHEVSCWSDANSREIAKLTTVQNRIHKAENKFEQLEQVKEEKESKPIPMFENQKNIVR